MLPQTRSRSLHGVNDFFYPDGTKLFKNIQTYGWVVFPQTQPSSFHGVKKPFRLDVKHSSLCLGRAPQHHLSRPNIPCHLEESFRFDVMQSLNNVQMNGWSCSPKHGPAHFTKLKNLLIWMVWSFLKTFELMAGPCSPKHGPVAFTVWKKLFLWQFCSHVKTFKLMAGPRSPTFFVTAQLISRRWRVVSFWCCADIQQRSNERLVVLRQTRHSSFHGVEEPSHLDGTKLFKNIRTNGWAVLRQTRPSFFTVLKNFFVWMLCSHVKTFKFMAGPHFPTYPVTAQLISRRWKIVSFWCCADF